ncbi:MAG TPA: hypothetical protein VGG41_10870 [Solirubrobacteraceae bacterium]
MRDQAMNHSGLYIELIHQRAVEIDRRAQRLGPLLAAAAAPQAAATAPEPVTVRLACAADWPRLRDVAELDSSLLPAAPLLVGERDGRAVAALSLSSGAVIADPFVATADVVALLHLRARQLGAERRRRPARALAWRLSRANGWL